MSVIARKALNECPAGHGLTAVYQAGLMRCVKCGEPMTEAEYITVRAADYEGAVKERDALRLMLSRLLDVALVDGYGETVADEARALLTTTGGQ